MWCGRKVVKELPHGCEGEGSNLILDMARKNIHLW